MYRLSELAYPSTVVGIRVLSGEGIRVRDRVIKLLLTKRHRARFLVGSGYWLKL